MSYDIFVRDLPAAAASIEDIPDDFSPKPLGPRGRIVNAVRRAGGVLDESGWASIEGPGYSIEVNLGLDDPVSSFAFHVRGGDTALFVVWDVLNELGCRALAPGTDSGFFELGADTLEAYARWRAYRDHATRGPQRDGS
jgi:hypothetical protein